MLRALGYRMERRPPLPPKPAAVEVAASEAVPAEAASETLSEAAAVEAAVASANIVAEETPAAGEGGGTAEVFQRSPSANLLPDIAFGESAPVEAPAVAEAQPEPVAAPEPAAMETPSEQVASEPSAVAETTPETKPVSEAAAPEPNAAPADAAAPARNWSRSGAPLAGRRNADRVSTIVTDTALRNVQRQANSPLPLRAKAARPPAANVSGTAVASVIAISRPRAPTCRPKPSQQTEPAARRRARSGRSRRASRARAATRRGTRASSAVSATMGTRQGRA